MVLVILVAASLVSTLVDGYPRHLILHEGGLIETASAVGYFVCAFLLARWGGTAFLQHHVALFATVLLLGFRELDFHRIFFSSGIFRTRLYVSADISISEKLLAMSLVLIVALAIVSTLLKYGTALARGLRSGRRGPLAVVFAIGLAVVAKAVDGVERKLSFIGYQLTDAGEQQLAVVEEVTELGIPLMMCLAVYYTLRKDDSILHRRGTDNLPSAVLAMNNPINEPQRFNSPV